MMTTSVTVMHWPPSASFCDAVTFDEPDTFCACLALPFDLRPDAALDGLVGRVRGLLLLLAVEQLEEFVGDDRTDGHESRRRRRPARSEDTAGYSYR